MDMREQNKIKRKVWVQIVLISVCLIISGCVQNGQEKVYHVGIVSGSEPFFDIANGFKAKMAELGYIEGKNIVYDIQRLNADPAGEQQVVKRFVEDGVDMIFAFPTEPALAAKAATQGTGIPVVFALAGIEGSGLIESVSRPGGNITGVRFPGPELTVQRLELLNELAPQTRRIYLIYDPSYPTAPSALEQLQTAAEDMGMTLVQDRVSNIGELQAALHARGNLSDIGVDAILIMPEILTQTPDGFAAILNFANEHKLPVGGSIDYTADLGAIFSFIPKNFEMGEDAAILAGKIFKGTPAGTIMVVTPKSYFRLNYRAIQQLELDVSESLLAKASEIIR